MKTTRIRTSVFLVVLLMLFSATVGMAQNVTLNCVKAFPNERYVMVTFLSGIEILGTCL